MSYENDPEEAALDRAFRREEDGKWMAVLGLALLTTGAVDALWGEWDIQKEIRRLVPVPTTEAQIRAASFERDEALLEWYIAERNHLPVAHANNRLIAVEHFMSDVRQQKQAEKDARAFDGDLTKPKNRLWGDAAGMALGFYLSVQGIYLRYRAQRTIYSYYNQE